jgi:hypothetical protein
MGPSFIPCTVMRGGTSKALFFLDSDLPSDQGLKTRRLLEAFGSPDVRQIDGMGGADPLTSKLAIIRPSQRSDIDVEYTFGQVSITEAFIDFSANCGNISSAVGPFAIDKGLVAPVEPITKVRILNTNTQKIITAEVPVRDGNVVTAGCYRIDGVPGTGAEIKLRFADPSGTVTGRLLPTEKPRDRVRLEDGRTVDVSLVDAGNPAVIVRADQVGLRGDELPPQLDSQPEILDTLEELRAKAAEMLGLCRNWREAYRHYRSIPKVVFVAPPGPYQTIGGSEVCASEIDLLARVMTMGRPHKAFAITASIPTAVASRIPGSVVCELCRQGSATVRIGHPSGVISVDVYVDRQGEALNVKEVIVGRTARKLMEGRIFFHE